MHVFESEQTDMLLKLTVYRRFDLNLLEHMDMFKRNVLSAAIVLAGSVWGSAALADTETGAKFSSAAEINKVSEWMGKDVRDNEGNDIGEISDFALNLKDGTIAYAVVDLGGMFSNEAIAVPLTALSSSAENEDELTLQVSKSEWESAETFSGSDWPLQASLAAGTGAAVTSMPDKKSTTDTADSGWQKSESKDQYQQGSGAVSSFDRDVEFDTLDTDGDGYLSTEEYQAAKGSTATGETDTNQDGRISRSEFAAFEAREQGSRTQKESSTYDRYEDSDKDHSYDSDDTDDLETDE